MIQIPWQQNGYIQCGEFSHSGVLRSPENEQSTTTFNDTIGLQKIMLSQRGQTQKSVPCMQSPQIAKVICVIRSQHGISVGLGSGSEEVREGPSLDSKEGSASWSGCCGCSVAKSCLTLCISMDCGPLGSSDLEILARRVEWVAMPSSKRSSWPRDWTHASYVSCIVRKVLYH